MSETAATAELVRVAEEYYDSDAADRFYAAIWGGEDIHIGIYESPDEPIASASRRTVQRIAEMLSPGEGQHILDLGAGYGGAARFLAKKYGCRVDCLNISRVQNRKNQDLTRAQGLSHAIQVIHGSFEAIPSPSGRYRAVWSQDAILHSGDRRQVLKEVKRVLAPGGSFIFTDPMQADACPPGTLDAVLARIHLENFGSFAWYRKEAALLGFEEVDRIDLTNHLIQHYTRVRDDLTARYEHMVELSTKQYVDRMLSGLEHWVEAGKKGHLAWGILHFRTP